MYQKHKKILKIFLISLFLLVALFEGLLFSISRWIEPELYQRQILEVIKKQTGQDVIVGGDIKFHLLPTPRLVIRDLEVDGHSNQLVSTIPSLFAARMEIYIDTFSIFSKKVEISGVTLFDPVLSLERANDNAIHWGWFNTKLLKSLDTRSGNPNALPLFVSNGVIKYQDNVNNENLLIEDINASIAYGKQLFINGKMQSEGHKFEFTADGKDTGAKMPQTSFPLNLAVTGEDGSTVKINSIIDPSGELPKIYGNFNVNMNDLSFWLVSKKAASPTNGSKKSAEVNNDKKSLPVEINGAWNLDGEVIKFQKIAINGLNSKGSGDGNIRWNNWYPTIAVNLDFDTLDYWAWKEIFSARIEAKKAVERHEDDFMPNYDFRKENPLPENIEVQLNINAQKTLVGKEEWKQTRLSAALDKGAFTINQCDINLGGGGLLSVFGVISQGGTGDLRFEGNIEAKGQSLHRAISMFYSAAKDMPNIGMGEFTISSNLYINSEELRLFEADIKVDGAPISGTITTYFTGQSRIDATVKLYNTNFDTVKDVLLGKEKNKTEIGFDWLRNLSTRLDMKVYVDKFNFMERKGDKASFNLYAYNGDLRISDLRLAYPDGNVDISCNINVNQEVPYVAFLVNADQLDTGYFDVEKSQEGAPSTLSDNNSKDARTIKKKAVISKSNGEKKESAKQYVDEQIPLDWMNYVNGFADISLGRLVHKNIPFEKVKLQARLEDRKISIQKMSFVYSQAESNVVGTLYGGKVPGLSASFTMSNADLYEVIKPLFGVTNISGYASLSGVISTSGWSFREWLNHMEAKLLVSAKGVKVQGINLAGVNSVVDIARSSADVFNNVNNILTKGFTDFTIDGSMSVKDGEVLAPSLTLRSGLITGLIVGGIKLESLSGKFSTTFRFANLSSESPPNLIVQLSGKLSNPEIKVDTSSLEDFVAKRNVGRNIMQ